MSIPKIFNNTSKKCSICQIRNKEVEYSNNFSANFCISCLRQKIIDKIISK